MTNRGRVRPGWLRAVVVLLVAAVLLTSKTLRAQGAEWTVLPMTADGVDPTAAATFRDVLESELMTGVGARFIAAPSPCHDVPCARSASAHTGATVVVFGMLRPLGRKVVAHVVMVDGPSGSVLATSDGSAEGVEQLDAVAKSLGRTLLVNARFVPPPTAQPAGPPPAQPSVQPLVQPTAAPPEPAQEEVDGTLRTGMLLRVGGFQPLDDAYGGLGMGMLFDVGAWIEADSFAFEPRLGLRFDTSTRDDASYVTVPIDLGAYFVPNLGGVRPFVGGGLGWRYVSEKRSRDVQLGTAVITEHRGILKTNDTALGAFGRAGMVLLANYKTHLILSAEYDVTFIDYEDESAAKAFAFGLAVVF